MALNVPRKVESDALLALLSQCYPWKSCTKFRPQLWANVNKADKPALFLVLPREKKEDRGINLQRRTRQYEAWVYLQVDATEDPANPVGNQVDDILDAIDLGFQTLNPDGSKKQPGSGSAQQLMWPLAPGQPTYPLVINAWVEGEVAINPGVPDPLNISIFIPIFTRTGNP